MATPHALKIILFDSVALDVLHDSPFGSEEVGRSVRSQNHENDRESGRLVSVPPIIRAVCGRTLHWIELHSKDVR